MFTLGQLLIFCFGLGCAGALLMSIVDKVGEKLEERGWLEWL